VKCSLDVVTKNLPVSLGTALSETYRELYQHRTLKDRRATMTHLYHLFLDQTLCKSIWSEVVSREASLLIDDLDGERMG